MSTGATLHTTFIIEDLTNGRFDPTPRTWEDAKAHAAATPGTRVRRLDEVLAER